MYKISIIIPCYYNIKFISRCLYSIKIQKSLSIIKPEVILINDNSPYFSDQEIQKTINYYSKYFQIKYLKNEKNQGPGYSRQQGLNNVSKDTQFIIFLDDDDFFANIYALENLYKKISLNTLYVLANNNSSNLTGNIFNYNFIQEKQINFKSIYYDEDSLFLMILFLEAERACFKNKKLKIGYITEKTYIHTKTNKNSLTFKAKQKNYIYFINAFFLLLKQPKDYFTKKFFNYLLHSMFKYWGG